MKSAALFLLSGLSLLSSATLSLAEKVDFTLKYKPGQTYLNEVETKQSMVMVMAGQPLNSSSEMTMVTYQNITEMGEGLQIEQGTNSVKMDMNTGGMQLNYDSEEPKGVLAATLQPLMEARTRIALDADGKITKVEAPAIPGMEMMGMGKEEMEQVARSTFDLFPGREVAEGEKWTSKTKMPMGGITPDAVELVYEMTFEKMVEAEGKKLAQVSLTGSMSDEGENISVKSKEITGTILFDPEEGQPAQITMKMSLEMGLPAGIPAEEGAPGVVPIEITTTSRLLEVKPTAE